MTRLHDARMKALASLVLAAGTCLKPNGGPLFAECCRMKILATALLSSVALFAQATPGTPGTSPGGTPNAPGSTSPSTQPSQPGANTPTADPSGSGAGDKSSKKGSKGKKEDKGGDSTQPGGAQPDSSTPK